MTTILVLVLALVIARPSGDVTAETARIRTHLATVEAELRSKDVSALTATQRAARARNLDVLHEYWVRGVFPVNTDFPGRRIPYFVDRYGTPCAMAYLIEQSGQGALVARIASTDNNAYVRDLQNDAELGAWLRENGLTAAEAARIQPSYGSPIADFEGRWNGKATFGPGDSAVVRYVLTGPASAGQWTLRPGDDDHFPMWMLTLANRDSIPLQVAWYGGDSLVMEGGPLAGMRSIRNVVKYGGNTLTGTIEIRYRSGATVRGRIEAALECPGPAVPEDVVTFVRRAGLPKVRCITLTRALLDRQASLFKITYKHRDNWFGGGFRTAVRWRGRVSWILEGDALLDSELPGTFRARPRDTLLVTPAFLKEMTALGLRLRWAKTLLQDPDAPRFVPLGLIAALKDTLDEGLAALLVSAPAVTRDPRLLAAMAHLPAGRDSAYRRDDGGMAFISTNTGYARARGVADWLLSKQSLQLIAARETPHEVLVTIATWYDRHLFACPAARPGSLFAALRARASRENDTIMFAVLAHADSTRALSPCQ